MNIRSLMRKDLIHIKPYTTARDEFAGPASVYLDANENPYPSAYQRYPDPHHKLLKRSLSAYKKVPPSQILFGNGSDEIIDLLIRAFCEPAKDHVIIPQPTYGMYSVCAQINHIAVRTPSLTATFDLDVEEIMDQVDGNSKILFLCSPNNPSGNLLSNNHVKDLLSRFGGLVVIDEAYIDFAPSASFLPQLQQYPNLVIVQTFSKAWGLAGLRLGVCFAQPDIIDLLGRIKPPYNINTITQEIALNYISHYTQKERWVEDTVKERDKLQTALQCLRPVKEVFLSSANFLLVRFDDAKAIYNYLAQNGIVVRDRSSLRHCNDCLRITVGTAAENSLLIDFLKKYEKTTFY